MIPGPRSYIPGRTLYLMSRDITGFLSRLQRDFGDLVQFRIGRRRIILVSHPDAIRDILVTRADNFTKGPALRMAKITLGEGLLTSEGDHHRRQRRLMSPAFHAQRVLDYADTIISFTARTRDRWENSQIKDIREVMTQLTLEIVAKALFDAEIASEVAEIGHAMDTTITMFDRSRYPWAPLLNLLPLPSNRRFFRARDRVFATIDRMIADRRARPSPRKDFLSLLLQSRDIEGDQQGMDDQQLRFEAMTLFSAGHETTANALVWTFLLLSQNPAAEEALHAELDRVLAGRLPTADDVDRLPYTRAVIAESMRLYPPAWVIGRQATNAHPVGGETIPKEAVILIAQWIVHRDPRWWDQPEQFQPERWLKTLLRYSGGSERLSRRLSASGQGGGSAPVMQQPLGEFDAATDQPQRPRYAYFPFGGGPRSCIGEPFAWLEAILILATVAQHWKLRRTDTTPVRLHATITLRPRDPLPMQFSRR